jgi:hypothetical protein
MTPVEKAKELVENMFFCDKSTPDESMAMLYPHAKQCALIAVDEIISNRQRIKDIDKLYWQQVKHEIEQL